jgi:hypothetical protein
MSETTRKELITAAKARKYLDKCARNRPVSDTHVKRLAAALKAGEWKLNGETLKFNDKEELEDGRHRLSAIIVSDTPMLTFVTRGLPSNNGVFDTIDTGLKRSVGHMFARGGEQNYALLAGAVSYLWRFLRGNLQTGHRISPRHAEAKAILLEHPGLRDSIIAGRKLKGLMSPSMAVCLHYLFCKKSQEQADEFVEFVATGENLSKSSPKTSGIYLLYRRLEDNRASKEKLPADEMFPLVVKAWNAYRRGEVVKTLRWRTGGDGEAFPTIA